MDINKGDGDNPLHRSRLVAMEFNTGDEDGLFAAPPPIGSPEDVDVRGGYRGARDGLKSRRKEKQEQGGQGADD